MNTDCRDSEDVVFRIKKAGNSCGALRKCFFSNPNISVDEKRAAYERLILSILLYGAESWCLTEKLFFMLRIFHNLFARSKCRATVTECYNFRISNEELLRRLNLREIYYYITKTQLPGAGHIAGRDFDRVREKCCLRGYVINTPGAPEFTFGHGLYKSLTKAGVDVKNCHALALDKSKWRKVLRCDT